MEYGSLSSWSVPPDNTGKVIWLERGPDKTEVYGSRPQKPSEHLRTLCATFAYIKYTQFTISPTYDYFVF